MNEKFSTGTIFVNPKQFHRIMIRRQEKLDFNAKYGISNDTQKKPYFNESRHQMAKKRVREGGRFAKQTPENIQKKAKLDESQGKLNTKQDLGPTTNSNTKSNSNNNTQNQT